MVYEFDILPRALKELDYSAAWYDEREDGLGNKFAAAFRARVNELLEAPLRYPKQHGHYRQMFMKEFPFFIVYRVNLGKKKITVTSVFHTSRNPRRKFRR